MKSKFFCFAYTFYLFALAISLQASNVEMTKGAKEQANPLSRYEKSLLERVKKAGPTALDLAIAMDENDLRLGSGIRNTSPLWYYYLVHKGQEAIPTAWNENLLKELIANRNYLMIVDQGDYNKKKILFIKNEIKDYQNGEKLYFFEEGTQSFKPLNQKELERIKIDPSSTLLFSKKILVDNDRVNHYHSTPSPDPFRSSFFYHEKQKGGQCAIHATNAFFGRRVATPNDLAHFTRTYFGCSEEINKDKPIQSSLFPEEFLDDYYREPDIADTTEGNNPVTIQAYIQDLARRGKIPSSYQNLQFLVFDHVNKDNMDLTEVLLAGVDRCIVGFLHPDHFIAFRQDQFGEWYKIDSESSIQQKTSPTAFISKMKGRQLFLFYPE